MAPPEKPTGPRREYATVGEAVLHCRQPERGGKACWDAEQFDRHLVRGGDVPIPSEPLCPRETRVRALRTGEDHLRGGWRSGGRRETDLDALITHQLHTSSPMDSAAAIAPEQRCRTHRQRMQQHTHAGAACASRGPPIDTVRAVGKGGSHGYWPHTPRAGSRQRSRRRSWR